MSSALRSSTTATGSGSTITCSCPAGVKKGDVLVAFVQGRMASNVACFWTDLSAASPAWFAGQGGDTTGGNTNHFPSQSYARVATASEPGTFTFTCTSDGTAGGTARSLAESVVTILCLTGVSDNVLHFGFSAGGGGSNISSVTLKANTTADASQGGAGFAVYYTYTDSPASALGSFVTPTGFSADSSVIGTNIALGVFRKDYGAGVALSNVTVTEGSNTNVTNTNLMWLQLDTHVNPTGLSGTGTLGSFSVVNGSNNSVNLSGLFATGTLGSIGKEVDYGNTFVGGAPPFNTVYVKAPQPYPLQGLVHPDVSAGVIDTGLLGLPAFANDAFQINAFQCAINATVPLTGLYATGALGSVFYQASYAPVIPAFGDPGFPFFAIGTVGALREYHVDYAITGVYGTGQVGVIAFPTLVPVTGLSATGVLGTVSFIFDCIFTLPKGIYYLQPMVGHIGAPNVTYDCAITMTGLHGTGVLGSVTPTNFYSVSGLAGTTHLGVVVPTSNYLVTGLSATLQLGNFVAGWVQTAPVSGVSGTASVNPPVVLVPGTYAPPGMSVQGAGGVGQVGFQISSTAAISGVVGTGTLGTPSIRVDGSTAPVGLVGATALGHVTALGMPRLDTYGNGQVGSISFVIDCNVHITGLAAAGAVGLAGETRSTNAHVTGVQAVGSLGVIAPAPQSAYDKRNDIYVRLQ
jgi:hypothetical protein